MNIAISFCCSWPSSFQNACMVTPMISSRAARPSSARSIQNPVMTPSPPRSNATPLTWTISVAFDSPLDSAYAAESAVCARWPTPLAMNISEKMTRPIMMMASIVLVPLVCQFAQSLAVPA